MPSLHKGFDWRIGFAVFCLLYAGWVVYLGLDNFEKVHGEYRWAVERLRPEQIEKIALKELVDQCRRKTGREGKRIDRYRASAGKEPAEEDPCLTWPQAVLDERQRMVADRLAVEAGKLKRRIVVFYATFGTFFLVLPLFCLYQLLKFLIWLFRGMKFIR